MYVVKLTSSDCSTSIFSLSSILIGCLGGGTTSGPEPLVTLSSSSEQGDWLIRFMLASILAASNSLFELGNFVLRSEVIEFAWCDVPKKRAFDVGY